MPKKFDTSPLDPEYPEKAKAKTASVGGYTSPQSRFKTAEFPTPPASVTEDETIRFDEARLNAQAFHGAGNVAAPLYQPPAGLPMNQASDRKETRTGVPEKWLIGLPYLPFSIGLVAGIILLLVIPKEETRVRFHAAQGLAANLGILIVTTILGIVGNVTDLAKLGSLIFTLISTVMLVIFAIKAWQSKPVHIQTVDELTNWLEDKIGPIRSS